MIKILRNIFKVISAIVFPVLVFITGKFYVEKHLSFEQSYLVLWTFVVSLISISLVIGLYALRSLSDMKKQNEELKQLIQELSRQTENNHHESILYMQNSRELLMEDD